MKEPLVQLENLQKSFGPIAAVQGLSLSVRRGEVLGLLGPNGAGKTTTIRMATGFLAPDTGAVQLNGHPLKDQPRAAQASFGYLPEGSPAYDDMTPMSYLTFMADVRNLQGTHRQGRLDNVITGLRLEPVLEQPIETLSKGYRRRVGLAQALLHDPPILFLDEPTDGLDPNQKHHMRQLITAMAKDKAIVISTHILEEVEAICTRAVIINQGRIVADGTPESLRGTSKSLEAEFRRLTDSRADTKQPKTKLEATA